MTLESWTLSLSELIPYAQGDTTIENDLRECGADFTWLHTGIWDNCPGGSVQVTYLFKDTIQDTYVITRDRFGRDTTRFFDVGLTTVRYTLTDANGNVSECSFDLTVLDTEPPVLVCPADTTLFLAGGECDIVYIPTDWSVTDNCVIRDTMTSPDWNLPLPIGVNPVDLTVTDTSGNPTTCTYVVTVVEYDPSNPQIVCIGDVNVSLDSDYKHDASTAWCRKSPRSITGRPNTRPATGSGRISRYRYNDERIYRKALRVAETSINSQLTFRRLKHPVYVASIHPGAGKHSFSLRGNEMLHV